MLCCWQQWTARSPRGRRAASRTRGVTSIGGSARRVSLALRLVRDNVRREGGPEGHSHSMSSLVTQMGGLGELCFLRKVTVLPGKALEGFMENRCRLEWR